MILFMLWNFHTELTAQVDSCVVDFQIPIAPLDTTILNIDINGLINNDLANNNSLCGVEIHFDHNRLANLRIELISPDGDIVNLVGPATIASNSTQLMSWEVNFLPCGFIANPDLGISSQWDNDNPWMIFNTYNGSYYPASGCLEDFNSGSVNGTWQLRIIDLGQFGDGVIEFVRLIFCDNTGIDCSPCFAYAGSLVPQSLSFCNAQSGLDQLSLDFENPPQFDINNQDLLFIIKDDNVIVDVQMNLDLTGFPPGNYQICSFVIDKSDLNQIPASIVQLEQGLNANVLCGDISSNCVDIVLYNSVITELVQGMICPRDSFENEGLFYFSQIDTIIYSFVNGQCEGTELSLVESDLNANVALSGELDCSGQGSVIINALSSSSSMSNNLDFIWTTINGNYLVDQGPIAQVDQAGEYLLTVDDGFCQDTVTVFVQDNGSSFQLDLNVDTIGCEDLVVNIMVSTSANIDSFVWNGPGLLLPISLNPFVDQAGIYVLEAYSGSCLITDSIRVVENRITPDFQVSFDTINCEQQEATVFINTALNNYELDVTPNQGTTINNDSIYISQGGLYTLNVIDESNQCSSTQVFEIVVDTLKPLNPDIGILVIPCSLDSIAVQPLNIGMDSISYSWYNDMGDLISNDFSIMVGDAQELSLNLLDTDNFCQSDQTVTIIQDEFNGNTTISGENISCDDINPEICSSETNLLYSYNWYLNNNVVGDQPCINAIGPGSYILEITDSDGCSLVDSILIIENNDLPFIDLESQLFFPCDQLNLSIDATGSDSGNNFNIDWESDSGMGIVSENGLELIVDSPGSYTLHINNSSNDCTNSQTIEILNPLEVTASISQPNCDMPNIGNVNLDVLTMGASFEVFIDNELVSGTNFDLEVGVYQFELIDANACVWSEQIEIQSLSNTLLELEDTIQITTGETLVLNPIFDLANNPASGFSWTPSIGLSCTDCLNPTASPEESTIYTLEVILNNACILTATIFVEVLERTLVYVPNVFSPNNDGINDLFTLGSNNANLLIESLQIFDRWGNLVFNVENTPISNEAIAWDGRFGDQRLNPGVFVYFISLNIDGQQVIRKGDFTLVR